MRKLVHPHTTLTGYSLGLLGSLAMHEWHLSDEDVKAHWEHKERDVLTDGQNVHLKRCEACQVKLVAGSKWFRTLVDNRDEHVERLRASVDQGYLFR